LSDDLEANPHRPGEKNDMATPFGANTLVQLVVSFPAGRNAGIRDRDRCDQTIEQQVDQPRKCGSQ
jgi:hypothetical protein